MPFWIISGAQRSPHTSNGQLWYHFGFNIVDQIHPNPFESVKILPDPATFGSAFPRLCEHMAQLSIRKSHPFGTAFPFERLSYGRNGLPFVNTFQSKRGSIRNGFGVAPRGPVGPSPQGRRRRPSVPLGTLGFPWVPLGPPQGIGTLLKRRKGVSRVWWRSGFTGERILGRRHARKRIWIVYLSP